MSAPDSSDDSSSLSTDSDEEEFLKHNSRSKLLKKRRQDDVAQSFQEVLSTMRARGVRGTVSYFDERDHEPFLQARKEAEGSDDADPVSIPLSKLGVDFRSVRLDGNVYEHHPLLEVNVLQGHMSDNLLHIQSELDELRLCSEESVSAQQVRAIFNKHNCMEGSQLALENSVLVTEYFTRSRPRYRLATVSANGVWRGYVLLPD